MAVLHWLRQGGCPWDFQTCYAAACCNQLHILRWARLQQPHCPWWSSFPAGSILVFFHGRDEGLLQLMTDRMWMFLAHNNAPLPAAYAVKAEDAEKRMTTASLVLQAVLPAAIPVEVMETILAMSIE